MEKTYYIEANRVNGGFGYTVFYKDKKTDRQKVSQTFSRFERAEEAMAILKSRQEEERVASEVTGIKNALDYMQKSHELIYNSITNPKVKKVSIEQVMG